MNKLKISSLALIFNLIAVASFSFLFASPVFADPSTGSWEQLGLSDRQVGTLADDPTNPDILYAGTDNGVYKSTDRGDTWTNVLSGGDTSYNVAVAPSNANVIYASVGNTDIEKSTDGGSTWTDLDTNSGDNFGTDGIIQDIVVNPTDANTAYVSMYHNCQWETTDGGSTWSQMQCSDETYRLVLAPSNSSIMYAGISISGGGVYVSTNAGSTWSNPGNAGLTDIGSARGIAVDPTNPNTLYIGTESQGAYKSTDGGANWTFLSNVSSEPIGAAIAADPVRSTTVYAGTGADVVESTDGGDTWSDLNSGSTLSGNVARLIVFPNNTNILYATSTSGVYAYGLTPYSSVKIVADPSSSIITTGTSFNVNVKVNSDSDHAFNAAQATVAVSSNLTVTGIHNATSNACNLQYTKHPTPSDPSFAGAIYGSSSTGCTVYTMTLTPTSTGTGTVTFTNTSIKSYADNSEIGSGVVNGSYTISDGGTPTPTAGLEQLTVTSPLQTYYLDNTYTLSGTKDSGTTTVFVNGSSTGVTYPTSTTWQVSETLAALGEGNTPSDNTFTIYGSDGTDQTATQTINVSRHTLGDINGDGVVDLTDASLFAVDWGKTSALTYALSDMNGDGNADLTDLSILAKLEE